MTSWVIVAIPRENDPVWRYSSEKVPHMTLLFLGEQTDSAAGVRMAEYLAHVAETTLDPFYMTVDNRGPLGPDEADVLFFKKDKHSSRDVELFRSFLLTNTDIKAAYDSTNQYPEWTPHLTMGYPKNPAKPDERDYPGFWGIEFDRVALWTGDYEGPTFPLKRDHYEYGDSEMAMASDKGDAWLSHFGVKGMHWGQRKSDPITTSTTIVKTAPKTPVKGINLDERKYRKANVDTAVTVVKRPGQKLATKGGSNRPASKDAVKAAAAKRVVQSSTTDALTNKQLQELVTRMNLEQQYKKLAATPAKKNVIDRGKDMMNKLLGIKTDAKKFINDPTVQATYTNLKNDINNSRKKKSSSSSPRQSGQLAIGK